MAVVQQSKKQLPSLKTKFLASGEVIGRSGRPIKIVDRSSSMADAEKQEKNIKTYSAPAMVPKQPSVVDLEQSLRLQPWFH